MAVGQGFEPREPFGSTVFKTAAFDHSASPPKKIYAVCVKEMRIIPSYCSCASVWYKKLRNKHLLANNIIVIAIFHNAIAVLILRLV